MVEKRIIEQLDACRSGRADDLGLPEVAEAAECLADDPQLSELFSKLQTFDSSLRQALDEVPIPEGLADRLLARLQVASPAEAPQLKALTGPGPHPVTNRSTRRLMLAATVGSMAGVAASVLVALALNLFHARGELTLENWRDLADVWYQQVVKLEPDSWKSLETAPRDYPVSDRVLLQSQGWHRFRCSVDGSAVAYDFTTPGGNRVTLMVVQAEVPGLRSSPPERPAFFTQGRSLAAWQSGDLVYVLVVEGNDPSVYRDLVDSSASPLAIHLPCPVHSMFAHLFAIRNG